MELNQDKNSKCQLLDNDGWYRFDNDKVTIFWHLNPIDYIALNSHGHCDIFSFILYYKGYPIIVDPGCYSYMSDNFSIYGKTASAHNVFTIDNFGLSPLPRFIYPPRYRKLKSSFEWNELNNGFYFKISSDGFLRISKELTAFREFYLTMNNLRIRDFLNGKGMHNVKTYFHFAPDTKINYQENSDFRNMELEVGGNKIEFHVEDFLHKTSIKILSGIREPKPAGWFFPKYGEALPLKTCIIESCSQFPYDEQYILTFK